MENLFTVCEVKLSYKPKVKASERYQVLCSRDLYNVLIKVYDEDTIEYKESFKVVLLNQANKVLGVHELSIGGIDGTYADVRQILQVALLGNATSIAISHNHPSGNTEPSISDKRLTSAIQQAAKTMNITLTDHLIVAKDSYYSFSDKGLI
ncbi:MAG: JAB domain-containing protein [Bacteroides sp.]|nr:JAB domain-containing protein [Bacteroides sp.]